MKRFKLLMPFHSGKIYIFFLCLIVSNCAGNSFQKKGEKLHKSIRVFNSDFERKQGENSAFLVHPNQQQEFLSKIIDVNDKIIFYESSVFKTEFYKNGQPMKPNISGEIDAGINKAIVTMHYQMVISPSTKLKSVKIEQEWVRVGKNWFVKPNLNDFFK
tara:strand:- start:10 stop:486 length:477 start_codon:yes stop_codon:yes gene_type:complete